MDSLSTGWSRPATEAEAKAEPEPEESYDLLEFTCFH